MKGIPILSNFDVSKSRKFNASAPTLPTTQPGAPAIAVKGGYGCPARWNLLAPSPERVRPKEQVAQGPPSPQGHPNPPSMLWSVVQHVAPLAERPDVAMPATAMSWIMVEMCSRQHDLGRPERHIRGRQGDLTTSTVPPDLFRLIPPGAIAQVAHCRAMRPATDLAVPLGPDEPDPVADLRPVDRVEVAQLRLDRYGQVPAQASRAAVRARGRWR